MRKYKQAFKSIYQKYSNKKFKIDNDEDSIIVTRVDKKKDILYEITKPKYIFYNRNNNLIKMKTNITNKRVELLVNYQKLVNKLDVTAEEKKAFEHERKAFIDLLERYYIYTMYHTYVNKIDKLNKVNLVINEMKSFLKDNGEGNLVLEGDLYQVDNSIIDSINQLNTERLNSYNNLLSVLMSNTLDKKKDTSSKLDKVNKPDNIKDKIKEYIESKKEINNIYNQIEKNAKMQDNYIDYIVSRLPKID
jgi:hypothetical protein